MLNKIYELLKQISIHISEPFWLKVDFLISTAFNVLGLVITFLAYIEARKAKQAAREAANSVRAVSVALELTEIVQKLEQIDIDIQYTACQLLFNEAHRKTRKLTATYRGDPELAVIISNIENIFEQINVALSDIRPFNDTANTRLNSAYWAVIGFSSPLVGHIGELIGSVANRTQ